MKTWFAAKATLPAAAEVVIYDEIGAWGVTSKAFVEALKSLGALDAITVRINSGGGDVFDGLAIYNTLRTNPARVTVVVDGLAASIASIIAMAGDEILMPENGWMMIHDPSAFIVGGAGDMEKMAETLRGIKQSLVGIYARRTGKDPAEIAGLMADETWMDGPAAVAAGFADEVYDALPVAANLDLSKFQSVPPAAGRLFGCGRSAKQPARKEVNVADQDTPAAGQPEQKTTDHQSLIERIVGQAPPPELLRPERPGQWMANGHEQEFDQRRPEISEADIQRRERAAEARAHDALKAAYRAGSQLGLESETQQLLDEGVPAADVSNLLIEIHARKQHRVSAVQRVMPSPSSRGSGGFASVGFSHDDPAVKRERMSNAIASAFVGSIKMPDDSRQYAAWRPSDMMRELLEDRGINTRKMTRADIVDQALHTTSDFPELLGTSANKIFLGSYEMAPQTFRRIAARADLSNFQAHNMLRDGDFPTLQKVLENGEFTRGTMSESKETASLSTYGRTFSISRQALINDSLGVFGRTVAKIGTAVARFENRTVWGIVTSNPTLLEPGVAMFHANNGNLAGSGAAISVTTLGTARAAMRVQKSLDGETLNIAPSVLVVPATKETLAESIVSPLVIPEAAANLTPPNLRLGVVTEALLDANSTTAWYVFADPMSGGANIVYGYLEGESAPRVRTNDPFNVDGIEFQVRLDFHATAVDFRFGYKNPGA